MNQHLYLRAYMAGIVLPTVLLLVALAVFCVGHFVFHVPAPITQLIVFPMAVAPNAFGAWNMLFVKLHPHWHVPIGLHGAALPFFLAPLGIAFGTALGFLRFTDSGLVYFGLIHVPYGYLAFGPFLAIAIYYLVWKYIVGSLNKLLGIAY